MPTSAHLNSERESHATETLESNLSNNDLTSPEEQLHNLSSIVAEVIRTILFFYQDVLHKNKTPKCLNTPKKNNKAHKLGVICLDKIADKKNNQ